MYLEIKSSVAKFGPHFHSHMHTHAHTHTHMHTHTHTHIYIYIMGASNKWSDGDCFWGLLVTYRGRA